MMQAFSRGWDEYHSVKTVVRMADAKVSLLYLEAIPILPMRLRIQKSFFDPMSEHPS